MVISPLRFTEVFQLSHFSLSLAEQRLDKRRRTREKERGIDLLGIYGFTTNKVSENFTSVQIKMTDLPVPSPAPVDCPLLTLMHLLQTNLALLHSKCETLLHSTKTIYNNSICERKSR